MHCKQTCPLPVVNKFLSCRFYGFCTQQLIYLVKFKPIKCLELFLQNDIINPTIWSEQCENVSLYLFLVENVDWGGLMDQHTRDIVHNIFIQFYMAWWCFIFSILRRFFFRSIAVLLMYQLEKAVSYDHAETRNNTSLMSLWSVIFFFFFLILSQLFDFYLCCFIFPRWRAEYSFWTRLKP